MSSPLYISAGTPNSVMADMKLASRDMVIGSVDIDLQKIQK